jgi:hypothetical protein
MDQTIRGHYHSKVLVAFSSCLLIIATTTFVQRFVNDAGTTDLSDRSDSLLDSSVSLSTTHRDAGARVLRKKMALASVQESFSRPSSESREGGSIEPWNNKNIIGKAETFFSSVVSDVDKFITDNEGTDVDTVGTVIIHNSPEDDSDDDSDSDSDSPPAQKPIVVDVPALQRKAESFITANEGNAATTAMVKPVAAIPAGGHLDPAAEWRSMQGQGDVGYVPIPITPLGPDEPAPLLEPVEVPPEEPEETPAPPSPPSPPPVRVLPAPVVVVRPLSSPPVPGPAGAVVVSFDPSAAVAAAAAAVDAARRHAAGGPVPPPAPLSAEEVQASAAAAADRILQRWVPSPHGPPQGRV